MVGSDKVARRCRTCISSVTSFSASSGPTSRQSCRWRRPAAERSSGLAVMRHGGCHIAMLRSLQIADANVTFSYCAVNMLLPPLTILSIFISFQEAAQCISNILIILKQECSHQQCGSDMEDPHACHPIPRPDLPNLHESSRVTLLLCEGETAHGNFL